MSAFSTEITSDLGTSIGSFLVYMLTTLIQPSTTEITSAAGTLLGSFLTYLYTTFIQPRTKKNNTLRLIGTVYGPLRYFLIVRYIGIVANVLFLTFVFLFTLPLILYFFSSNSGYLIYIFFAILIILGILVVGYSHIIGIVASVFLFALQLFLFFFFSSNSGYLIKIVFVISIILGIFIYYFLFNLWIKKDRKIREIIDEISAYIMVDIDSLTLRWKALYWGTLVLAEQYFFLIFIAVFSTTLTLFYLYKGLTVQDAVLIGSSLISSFIFSLEVASFARVSVLGSNDKRLKVSFFDTSDEIESRLFNIIKVPSLCLCIVDDKGNKHCGSLEGITYSVLIRDKGGILVGIPYDRVYRVEECKG